LEGLLPTSDSFDHPVYARIIARLAIRREELGLRQDDVGLIIGVADRLVSKWEAGTRRPGAFMLACWMDALGVSDLKLQFDPTFEGCLERYGIQPKNPDHRRKSKYLQAEFLLKEDGNGI
jgi:transcriptional regulator with XRE-family HTH domain